MGPAADIKSQFVESGFDDRSSLAGDTQDEPVTKQSPSAHTGLVWNIEAQYLLSPKSAFGMTLGTINQNTITGYDAIGNGNSLQLRSTTYAGSIKYIYRLRQGRDDLSVGPVIARMSIKDDASQQGGIDRSPFKAGFNVGYSFSVLQKKSWFIALRTNYTWLPTTEIGPYTKEHKTAISQDIPNVYSSVFEQTDVRLSSVYIGVSAGWRW